MIFSTPLITFPSPSFSMQNASMEGMADAHPRFFLELLVAHLSDLQQKQQSKIFLRMGESSQLWAPHSSLFMAMGYTRIAQMHSLTKDLSKKGKNKSAIMNTDMEWEIYQLLEKLSIRKVSRCAHWKCTLANPWTLYTSNFLHAHPRSCWKVPYFPYWANSQNVVIFLCCKKRFCFGH